MKAAEEVKEESAASNDLTYTVSLYYIIYTFFKFKYDFILQKVIQRIVKRFLLSKQRESDDVNETDFEELKQDLQMIRFEIANELRSNSDETMRCMSLIHYGIVVLGEEILKSEDKDSEIIKRFKELSAIEMELQDLTMDAGNDMGSMIQPAVDRNAISLDEGLNAIDKLEHEVKVVKLNSMPNIPVGPDADVDSGESKKTITIDNVNFEIVENVDEQIKNRPLSKFGQRRLTKTKTISLVELNAIKEEEEQSGTQSDTDLPSSHKTTL